MKKAHGRRWLPVLALLTLSLLSACGRSQEKPLIFAAASLADVLTDAAEQYEEATGIAIDFSFGGSTTLARQVAGFGAPADAVIFAGLAPAEFVFEAGRAERSGMVVLASNRLVLVASDQNADLAAEGPEFLRSGDLTIAIPDPGLAPAGAYARDALIAQGLWSDLQGRVAPTLDVRAALAAVTSGSTDFAIVYQTDATTEDGIAVLPGVDLSGHEPIVYPAVVITGASQGAAAQGFLEFLASPDGQSVFSRYGFLAGPQ